MSERDNENFDLDDEFLNNAPEDGTDYDRILDRVDKRVRTQGKRGKAAWSKLEEVLLPIAVNVAVSTFQKYSP
jgi:hypothetical protein